MNCPHAAALAALGTWASFQSYWIRGSAKHSSFFFFLNRSVGWFWCTFKFENHWSNVLKYLYLDPILRHSDLTALGWDHCYHFPLPRVPDVSNVLPGMRPSLCGQMKQGWTGPCWVSTLVSLAFLSAGITRDRWLMKKEMACPEAFSWGSWLFLCLLSFSLLPAEQHRPVNGDDDFLFFFCITEKIVQLLQGDLLSSCLFISFLLTPYLPLPSRQIDFPLT